MGLLFRTFSFIELIGAGFTGQVNGCCSAVRRAAMAMYSAFLLIMLVSGSAYGVAISAPSVVISSKGFEVQKGVDLQPDGPLSTFRVGGTTVWLLPFWDKTHGGIVHVKSAGDASNPLRNVLWIKTRDQLFLRQPRKKENYWIVNTYQAEDGILGFVHVENADGTGLKKGGRISGGKSRIALAWSRDDGNTFELLGNIIIPYGDPNPFNVQGAPYLVKNGYFYLYFHDTCGLAVARAPVKDVLAAARQGGTVDWLKYGGKLSGFIGSGLGGESRNIGIDGISHSDAACSATIGECYLILTRMTWGGQQSWIKLYQSSDGVGWTFVRDIASEQGVPGTPRGYQYASVVDVSGGDNSMVGSHFYVYSDINYRDDDREAYRWAIELRPDAH